MSIQFVVLCEAVFFLAFAVLLLSTHRSTRFFRAFGVSSDEPAKLSKWLCVGSFVCSLSLFSFWLAGLNSWISGAFLLWSIVSSLLFVVGAFVLLLGWNVFTAIHKKWLLLWSVVVILVGLFSPYVVSITCTDLSEAAEQNEQSHCSWQLIPGSLSYQYKMAEPLSLLKKESPSWTWSKWVAYYGEYFFPLIFKLFLCYLLIYLVLAVARWIHLTHRSINE